MLKQKTSHHSTKEKLQKQISALLKRWQDAHAKYQGNEPAILLSREIREMRLMLCHCLLEMIHAEPLHYGTSSLNLLWEKLFYPHFVMTKRLKKMKKHDNLSSVLVEYRNVLGLAASVLRRAMAIIYCHHSNQDHLTPFLSPFIDIITTCHTYKKEIGLSTEVASRLEYQEWSVDALFLCLMHLGDVYRYHLDLKEEHYKLFAQRCYNVANMLKPSEGLTFNAIGNLDTSTYYGLPAVYNYMQALTVTNSFPSAKMNLEVVLNRCSHLLRILLSCKRKSERNANARMKQILAVKHFIHRFLAIVHRSILPHSAHAKMDVRDVCVDISRRFVSLLQNLRVNNDGDEEGVEPSQLITPGSLSTDRGSPSRLTTIIIHLIVLTTCLTWDYTLRYVTSTTQNKDDSSLTQQEGETVNPVSTVREEIVTKDCLADLCLTLAIVIIEHTLSQFHNLCLREKARTKYPPPSNNASTGTGKKENLHETSSLPEGTSELTNQIQMLRRKRLTGLEEDSSDLSEGNEFLSDGGNDSDDNPDWQKESSSVVPHDSEEDDQKMRSHYGIPMEDLENVDEEEEGASESSSIGSSSSNDLADEESHMLLSSQSGVNKSKEHSPGMNVPSPIRLPRAGTALKAISEEVSPSHDEQRNEGSPPTTNPNDVPGLESVRDDSTGKVVKEPQSKMAPNLQPSDSDKIETETCISPPIDWAAFTSSDSDIPIIKDDQGNMVEAPKEKVTRRRHHKKCRLSISELSNTDLLLRAKMLHSLESYLACIKILCDWYDEAFPTDPSQHNTSACCMIPLFWISLKDLLNVTTPVLALSNRLSTSEVARVVKTKLPLSSSNSQSSTINWKQEIPLKEDRLLYGTHFLQRAHENLDIQQSPSGPLEETLLRVESIFRFAHRRVITSTADPSASFLKYHSSKEEKTCCLFSTPPDLAKTIQWNQCLLPDTCLPRSVQRANPLSPGTGPTAVDDLSRVKDRERGDMTKSGGEHGGSRHQDSNKLEMMKRMAALRLQSEVTRLEGHRRQQHHGRPAFLSKRDADNERGISHRKTGSKQGHFHGRGSRNVLPEGDNWPRSARSLDGKIRRRRQKIATAEIAKHSGDSANEEDNEEGSYRSSDNEFSPGESDVTLELKELSNHPLLGTVYLIPDTYCFMEHLHCVKNLLQSGYFLFIVPHVVVNHLDFLKKDNPQARNAIRFLEFHTKRGNRFMRFQHRNEQVESKVIQQYLEAHHQSPVSSSHSHHQHGKYIPPAATQSNYHWRWHQLIACAAFFHNQQRKSTADGSSFSRSVSILTDRDIPSAADSISESATSSAHQQESKVNLSSGQGMPSRKDNVSTVSREGGGVDMVMSKEILEMADHFNVNIQHIEIFTKTSLQIPSSKSVNTN